jgi:hypothetical protein
MARIFEIEKHKVKTGESIASLAKGAGISWQDLAKFNWGTDVPDEINKHLRDEVGCSKKTPDGFNYVFDDSDKPGIVYIPKEWKQAGLATEMTHTLRVQSMARFLVILKNDHDLRIPEAEYEATLADGSKRSGRLGRGGVDAIDDPPVGDVEVKFPDLDDIEAKSLAATVRKAFDDRNPKEIHRLFRYPPETVQRAFKAYDKYFNDYRGQGLRNDIEQEWSGDSDAMMVLLSYLGEAKIIESAQAPAELPADSSGESAAEEEKKTAVEETSNG